MIFGEKKVYKKLQILYSNGVRCFFICGDKGCGKSYVINHFLKNINCTNVVTCEMYNYDSSDEYTPYRNGISKHNVAYIKPTVNKLIDDIPSSNMRLAILSKILSFARDTHNQVKNNEFSIFSQQEMDIVSKINFLSQKGNITFVFDNVFEWDYSSQVLLSKIIDCKLHRNMFKNALFIITILPENNNFGGLENTNCGIIEFDDLCYDNLSSGELSKLTNENIECSIIEKILPIIKVCGNDLELLKRIVNDLLCNNALPETNQMNERLDIIQKLLLDKLQKLGAEGKQINDILEYASILGMHFSVFELEKAIDTSKDELLNVIKRATDLCLLSNATSSKQLSNAYFSFAHEFIRKIFEKGVTKHRIEVYEKLSLSISKITPYDYLRRARYNIQANNFNVAESLYILYFFQQIRNSNEIPNQIIKEFKGLYSENNIVFKQIEKYKEGVELYNEKKYNNAYNVFSSIYRLSSIDVIAELDIMISMCLTKQLDSNLRNKAIDLLKDNLEKNVDISVKERLQIRLIITYAHMNKTLQARELDKTLCESLSSRRLYDKKAMDQYMILQRIANSYCDCEISLMKMQQAVDYFGPYKSSLPENIIQYFLASINYAGALCMNGKFNDSFNVSKHIFDLQTQYNKIYYPRTHININNYIVSGFLSDNLTATYSLEKYLELMDIVPYSAERMFFISNLSIFYSLCGQHQKAYDIITDEAVRQNIHKDPEKIYNYRYCTNASVFKFMMGEKDIAVKILNNCPDINNNIPDAIYMQKKIEMLKNIFTKEDFLNENNFLYMLRSKSTNETSEKYYLLGYTFTTLYNWDID